MDNTILIWKYLLPQLTENEEFSKYIDEKYIYPIAALEGTPVPYIIYRRDSLVPSYSKYNPGFSGWTNNISISLSVYSDNYNESAYIANLIRDIFENYTYEDEDIKIHPIELTNSLESVNNNVFEQTLIFSVTAE